MVVSRFFFLVLENEELNPDIAVEDEQTVCGVSLRLIIIIEINQVV